MIFFFSKVMHSDVCVTRRRLFLSSFFASSFSSLKKKGQIRARRDEGDLVICGVMVSLLFLFLYSTINRSWYLHFLFLL